MTNRVVDLCAAPGSWSQVLAKRLIKERPEEERDKAKIVAVDLQGRFVFIYFPLYRVTMVVRLHFVDLVFVVPQSCHFCQICSCPSKQ